MLEKIMQHGAFLTEGLCMIFNILYSRGGSGH